MGVPVGGNFDMYSSSADDEKSIAGGIKQGGDNVDGQTTFTGLISNSDQEFFDPDFAGYITSLSHVSESIQYRNYPVTPAPTPAPVSTPDPPTSPPTSPPTQAPTPAPVTAEPCTIYRAYDNNGNDGQVRYVPCTATDGSYRVEQIGKFGTFGPFCAKDGTAQGITSSYQLPCHTFYVENYDLTDSLYVSHTDCLTGATLETEVFPDYAMEVCSSDTPTRAHGSGYFNIEYMPNITFCQDQNNLTVNQDVVIENLGPCSSDNNIYDAPTPPPTSPPTGPPTPPPTSPPTRPPTPAPISSTNRTYSCTSSSHLDFYSSSMNYIIYDPVDIPSSDTQYANRIQIESFERPNRVTVIDDSGTVYDSGWMGFANYSGPWGNRLNDLSLKRDNFDYNSSTGRQIRVYGGAADPSDPISDAVNVIITCGYDSDLTETDVYQGDTADAACTRNSPGTTVFKQRLYFDNADWTLANNVYYNAIPPLGSVPAQYISLGNNWRYWDGQFFGASGTCDTPNPPTPAPTVPPTPAPTGTTIYKYEISGCSGGGTYHVTTNDQYAGPYSNGDLIKFELFGTTICGTITGTSTNAVPYDIAGVVVGGNCNDPICLGFTCYEYELEAKHDAVSTFSYIDCDGNTQTRSVDGGDTDPVCTRVKPTINTPGASVTFLGNCTGATPGVIFPPTQPPTSPPTPPPVNVGTLTTPSPTSGLYLMNLGTTQYNINQACEDYNNFIGFNGWVFRAGTIFWRSTYTAPGLFQQTNGIQPGFHHGSIFADASIPCNPAWNVYGQGLGPTTTMVNLSGTDCAYLGGGFPVVVLGQGLRGAGNVNHLLLTQFITNSFGFFMAISSSSGTDPGSTSFSNKVITNSLGQEGRWSATLSLSNSYVDNNGTGSTITPERFAYISVSGVSMVDGVTYYLRTD